MREGTRSVELGLADTPRLLKRTLSCCPVCVAEIPAELFESGGRVVMRKACPAHGDFDVLIARDSRYYYDSRGSSSCGSGCGCGPANAVKNSVAEATAGPTIDPFEVLSTCIALIEIVDSCNLKCPTCFASSPWAPMDEVKHTSFDEFVRRVQGVIDRKGTIDVLQLSGGEPTLHPEFFRLLTWAVENPKVGHVLINTNAVRLSSDERFRDELGEVRRRFKKLELYVQFDGVQSEGQSELRGGDFRQIRERAIDRCGALGVPSTLAMVVTPATISHLGEALRFGLVRPHCRGIVFQPMFNSGRTHHGLTSGTLPVLVAQPPTPISVGDLIVAIVEQSAGLLTEADFTPLPCGDPNCHTIGYLLRKAEGPVPLSRLIDAASMQGFLRDRVDYRLEDLAKCGCESEPLAEAIRAMELGADQPFRIFIKPFMDAWTFDQDRIDRCCTHVIRRDGTLDSFCRYYLLGGEAGIRG